MSKRPRKQHIAASFLRSTYPDSDGLWLENDFTWNPGIAHVASHAAFAHFEWFAFRDAVGATVIGVLEVDPQAGIEPPSLKALGAEGIEAIELRRNDDRRAAAQQETAGEPSVWVAELGRVPSLHRGTMLPIDGLEVGWQTLQSWRLRTVGS
jgi:hypothetical protein